MPLLDDRGTLMGVADAATGTILEKLYYNASGLCKSFDSSGASDVENVRNDDAGTPFNIGRSAYIPFGWCGMAHDPYTGRYHTHYRDYDPVHARWLTEDPAGYQDGLNLYAAYMGVMGVDQLGLAGYFFDGTANHPHRRNLDGSINYLTNVRKLHMAYDQKSNGKKYYAYGIGSGYTADGTEYSTAGPMGKWNRSDKVRAEQITGDTLDARVSWMIENLERELKNGDKNVDLYGFSRGSASGLVFLNRIQDQIDAGNPLYKDINIRFVGLMDAVSAIQSKGFYSKDIHSKRASGFDFSLPANMKFQNQPIHIIALDEQRKEFRQVDVQGALQIGFRGVHSDAGGGYPYNPFDWIVRDFLVDKSNSAGVVFNQKVLGQYLKNDQKGYDAFMYDLNKYEELGTVTYFLLTFRYFAFNFHHYAQNCPHCRP